MSPKRLWIMTPQNVSLLRKGPLRSGPCAAGERGLNPGPFRRLPEGGPLTVLPGNDVTTVGEVDTCESHNRRSARPGYAGVVAGHIDVDGTATLSANRRAHGTNIVSRCTQPPES